MQITYTNFEYECAKVELDAELLRLLCFGVPKDVRLPLPGRLLNFPTNMRLKDIVTAKMYTYNNENLEGNQRLT